MVQGESLTRCSETIIITVNVQNKGLVRSLAADMATEAIGWAWSAVECLSSVLEALGPISSTVESQPDGAYTLVEVEAEGSGSRLFLVT